MALPRLLACCHVSFEPLLSSDDAGDRRTDARTFKPQQLVVCVCVHLPMWRCRAPCLSANVGICWRTQKRRLSDSVMTDTRLRLE